MFAKIRTALRLWISNFPMISALVLLVWVPGNVLTAWVSFLVNEELEISIVMILNGMIDLLVSPIYAGAVMAALPSWSEGRFVGFGQALRTGILSWPRLVVAYILYNVGFLIGLAAIVIPGLVVAIRWSLMDAAVVIEKRSPTVALRRSWTLTRDCAWQILGSLLIYAALVMMSSIALYTLYELAAFMLDFSATDRILAEVGIDCVFDVLSGFEVVLMFVFFREATHGDAEHGVPKPIPDEHESAHELPPDDGNPYRPPTL